MDRRVLWAPVALMALAVVVGATMAPWAGRDRPVSSATTEVTAAGTDEPEAAGPRRLVVRPGRDLSPILGRSPFKPLFAPTPAAGAVARVMPASLPPAGAPLTFEPGAPAGEAPAPGGPESPRSGGSGGSATAPGHGGSLGQNSSCDLGITGIVRNPSGFRVLVRHNPTGKSQWAGVGEVVFGYRIELITLRGALVVRDGRYFVLPIGENVKGTEAAAQPAAGDNGKPTVSEGGSVTETQGDEGEGGDARFVGTWSGSMSSIPITITLNADHTGRSSVAGQSDSFHWTVQGNAITTTGGQGPTQTMQFRFESNNRVLVLSGGPLPFELRLSKQ
ncbi:MAG TPA: hypothetical protein PLD23_09030 [Armatimonadota bacterium]|nr:hypothetical protein [Armatimonadota bacterium]